MNVSCTLTPDAHCLDLAVLAEQLGYDGVWVNDSPTVHADVWMLLARIAERTSRIPLGPGVTVPSLRHVMVTAAAAGTLEAMAPGRSMLALGTGETGRRPLGQPPMRWSDVRSYALALRGLLDGQRVVVDGAPLEMQHPAGAVAPRPVRTPIVVAANGPKGLAVAQEVGDGVLSLGLPRPGMPWSIVAVGGTVLDEDESPAASRVVDAAGPALAVGLHALYMRDGDEAIAALPGGREWLDHLATIPPEHRALEIYRTHYVEVAAPERAMITPELLLTRTFTGTPEHLRQRAREHERHGATELSYHPSGPDPERELVEFARMMELDRHRVSRPRIS